MACAYNYFLSLETSGPHKTVVAAHKLHSDASPNWLIYIYSNDICRDKSRQEKYSHMAKLKYMCNNIVCAETNVKEIKSYG